MRLARPDEIENSQRLRYDVFYREYGAKPIDNMAELGRDYDDFDGYADHMIVVDENRSDNPVVGTYRLLRQDNANKIGQFYTDDEFDISSLRNSEKNLMELGRSCVHPDYRTRPVLQMLWQGIAAYISHYNVDLMFGCASFQGTNVQAIEAELSYLHHFHRSPVELRPLAVPSRYVEMNILAKDQLDPKLIMRDLPSLIKGYLRIGCSIGDGAIVDHQFNTTDVCIVLQAEQIASRYSRHFARKNEQMEAAAKREVASL